MIHAAEWVANLSVIGHFGNYIMDQKSNIARAIPKELSWLAFNERVLQEAADPTVPLVQRVRYLGIFSNNLDEFFRVRVADVRRLALFNPPTLRDQYLLILDEIKHKVLELQQGFDRVYRDLLVQLRKKNIYLINETQLDEAQGEFIRQYFDNKIMPELAPVLLSERAELPKLADGSINLAIKLDTDVGVNYAILEVPTERIGRFVLIPQPRGSRRKVLIALDNIIRYCMADVFRGVFQVNSAEAYTVKLSRDAELEFSSEVTESFVEKVERSLKKRKNADLVRLVYDANIPEDLLRIISKGLGLGKYDSAIPGGRYHNSKDFMSFPNFGKKSLEFKPQPPIAISRMAKSNNYFECIQQKDVLFFYPYHSFDYTIEFIKAAALDPAVKSIKISLYRVAEHSLIVHGLLNAVKNKKEVTAVLELQARFDEQANIHWAQKLVDEGVNVIFGVSGLKVHSKLIQVVRREGHSDKIYSYIGTGNFNEKTAKLYSDFGLLTYNQEIGKEVGKVFEFIKYTFRHPQFDHLWMSPLSTRSKFVSLLNQEIENAKAGKKASVIIKCNNLEDKEIIEKLYQAAQHGVELKLIVRSMCVLNAGVPNISETIESISIVDRYLEHARVYVFENEGEHKIFISSADLMTRNIDYRVEVTCPVYDKDLQKTILGILELQWRDNVKARSLRADCYNQLKPTTSRRKIRCQQAIYSYLLAEEAREKIEAQQSQVTS